MQYRLKIMIPAMIIAGMLLLFGAMNVGAGSRNHRPLSMEAKVQRVLAHEAAGDKTCYRGTHVGHPLAEFHAINDAEGETFTEVAVKYPSPKGTMMTDHLTFCTVEGSEPTQEELTQALKAWKATQIAKIEAPDSGYTPAMAALRVNGIQAAQIASPADSARN
jgi:hypothetical protein